MNLANQTLFQARHSLMNFDTLYAVIGGDLKIIYITVNFKNKIIGIGMNITLYISILNDSEGQRSSGLRLCYSTLVSKA